MLNVAIVGGGWRAKTYIELIKRFSNDFNICAVVVRNPKTAVEIAGMGVNVVDGVDKLRGLQVDFAITSVSKLNHLAVCKELANLDIPILAETPVGIDEEHYKGFLELAKKRKIQVAEQYALAPGISALIKLVKSGEIGEVNSVYISACHDYHAISVIRQILGVSEVSEVKSFDLPDEFIETEWRGNKFKPEVKEHIRKLALIKFGNKYAVYDFCSAQYFADARPPRITVRGTLGEADLEGGVKVVDDKTVAFKFERENFNGATNLNLRKITRITCQGKELYKNPFNSVLTGEQTAMATVLFKMKEYVLNGEEFYSVARAVEDCKLYDLVKK